MKATVVTVLLLIALAVGFASHQSTAPGITTAPVGSSVPPPAHKAKALKLHLPLHVPWRLLSGNRGNNGNGGNQDQGTGQ